MNLKDWHARYQQQARWTQTLRQHLFAQAQLETARRVLDLGCGTGALLGEVSTNPLTCGLDHDLMALHFARQVIPRAAFTAGDACNLPFASAAFNLSFCHFLLLWLPNPLAALREMRRVTVPGGMILALAEPDYGGRIDYPPSLSSLGQLQTEALRQQGAQPCIGRSLGSLFQQAGLQKVQSGVLGGFWDHQSMPSTDELEWLVLREDLQTLCSAQELDALQQTEQEARARGERLLYIPTFYALGHVPET